MGRREASLNLDNDKSSDALVSEIRETRRSIDSTLEQLGEAIKPTRLFGGSGKGHKIMDTVHKSTQEIGAVAENTRHKITGTVKDRPIAVGVLAAGVIASMVNIDAKL